MSVYHIKSFKSFQGREGFGFSLKLYKGHRFVADVLDEARGGEICFVFNTNADEVEFDGYVEQAKAKIPADKKNQYGMLEHDLFDRGIFILEIVEDFEAMKKWKRQCKTQTLFQVGDEIGSEKYFVIKQPYTPAVKAHIIKNQKSGERIRFINEEVSL